MRYCDSLTTYSRFRTREVKVGDLGIGGTNPIRIQSMTTTDTMDTAATVAQSIRMIEAGCELVRITAPSLNDARNLEIIKKELRAKGFDTPLVADIHFTPNAAEYAARVVEKVRVNPGNYADKKKFEHIEYTDSAYHAELDRIRNRFIPLVRICKEYGTAMRVGTNHGSLSDRILSRYGDTPLGMVESAMEFVSICEEEGYREIILSMKASNPQVMIQAYRLLVARMIENGQNYPLHLGVTEAGEGEDGRIKSAVGIGTLLEDGLGDTIRVSLTEEPEAEIPVAQKLAARYTNRNRENSSVLAQNDFDCYSPFDYSRRNSLAVEATGGHNVPRVIISFDDKPVSQASLFSVGYKYSVPLDKWNIADHACDFIYTGRHGVNFEIPGTLGIIHDYDTWVNEQQNDRRYPLIEYHWDQLPDLNRQLHPTLNFIRVSCDPKNVLKLSAFKDLPVVLVVHDARPSYMQSLRHFFIELKKHRIDLPVIMEASYADDDPEVMQLYAATDLGGLLTDGFGDGIWLRNRSQPAGFINQTTFNILQATRTRISKTEYISCPSCGRTLFDLQETTARIRARTSHLKGVKIGIMGCIVNGPGEMADADYGYVGTGPGKITLYKGREVVRRNIPSAEAVDQLVELIREHGDWVESSNEN